MKYAYPWDWTEEPLLDERSLEEARSLLGVRLRRTPFNTEASRIAIVRFARGIGDRNPLWLEEEYGRGTRWGVMLAPPTFLYSVDDTLIAPRLRGIHSLYAGADWQFFRLIRLGDTLSAEARLLDAQEKEGRFCGRMILQVGEVVYRNQREEVVAKVQSRVMRTPRLAAREKGKYLGIPKYRYTGKEPEAIEEAYDAEEIRGPNPRYWEEVKEGDELPPVVKGPLTSEDILSFVNATRPVPVFGLAREYLKHHPAGAYLNPETGLLDLPQGCLIDDTMARLCGFPAAHDTGLQRVAWLGHLLTNWMGDDGFLKDLSVDLLLPNIYGDTTWCRGRVARKYLKGEDHLVEGEVWAENQRKETTARGRATVALPSRSL